MIKARKELLQVLAEKMASVMRRVHAGQGCKFSAFLDKVDTNPVQREAEGELTSG